MNSSSTLDDTNGSRDYFDALIDAFTADEFSENSGNESTISSSLIRPKRKKRKKSRKAGPKPKAVKEYYSTPTVVNCVDQSGKQDKQLALSLLKQEQDLFEHHGVSQILVQFFQMEPGADDDIDGTDAQLLLQLRVSNVEDAFVGDNIDEDHATLSSIIDRQLSDDLSQLDGQQEGDVFGDDEIDRQYFKYVQEFRGQDPSNTCLFSQILQFISTKSEVVAAGFRAFVLRRQIQQAVSTTDNGESDSESDVDDIADNQRVDGRPSVTIQQQLPQDGVFKQYFTSGVRTGGNSVIINVEKEFRQSRPVNTQKEYAGPVKEWREFCQTLGLTDFVYEIKMLAYLKYVVSNIAVQRQINDRVKGKTAYSLKIVGLAIRREGGVQRLLTITLRGEVGRWRSEYKDKGALHFSDTYSCSERSKVAAYFFMKNTISGFRNRMDFLLGDAMLQRGDEKRRILLSDIAIRIYPSQSATGPSPAICLVITMNQGKTLKNGRVQYAGCFRGLDVLTCPVAAVGFYLQYRWMKDSSCPFPDFSSRKSWYDIVLLKSVEDETEALTYQSQHAVLSKCFKDLNIMISKVTHSNRMAGAQMLEQHDVERAGIQNHGRWRGDDLQSSYLTNLSLRSMRLLSGARGKGQYYIPRAAISVPEVFSEKVFPQLKVAKAVVMDAGREEQDLAAKHFLDLLEQLSVIMCQDAVILMYEYPNSSLWTLPPYCLPEFNVEFLDQHSSAVEQNVDISPAIVAHYQQLAKLTNVLSHRVKQLETSIATLQPQMQELLRMMQFQLQAQGFGAAYRNVQLDEAAKSARTSSAVLPPANGFRFADNPKSFKFLYEEYYGIGLFQHCKGVQQMEQDGALYRRGDENLRKAFSKRRPAYALFDNFTLAGDRTETLLATLDLLRGEQSMFKWLDRVQEPQNELWRHPLFQPMRAKVLEQLQAKATVSTSTKKQAKTVLQNAASVDSGVAQGASNGTGVSLLNLASADGNADGTIRIPNINSYTQFCADMGNGRKDLHELWRAMSAEEKQVYKDRAAEVRRPYEELKARELEQKKVAESNIRKSRRK